MPTTYAHDLFGKKGLPETFRKITASDPKQRKSVPDRTAWSGYPVLLFYIQKVR